MKIEVNSKELNKCIKALLATIKANSMKYENPMATMKTTGDNTVTFLCSGINYEVSIDAEANVIEDGNTILKVTDLDILSKLNGELILYDKQDNTGCFTVVEVENRTKFKFNTPKVEDRHIKRQKDRLVGAFSISESNLYNSVCKLGKFSCINKNKYTPILINAKKNECEIINRYFVIRKNVICHKLPIGENKLIVIYYNSVDCILRYMLNKKSSRLVQFSEFSNSLTLNGCNWYLKLYIDAIEPMSVNTESVIDTSKDTWSIEVSTNELINACKSILTIVNKPELVTKVSTKLNKLELEYECCYASAILQIDILNQTGEFQDFGINITYILNTLLNIHDKTIIISGIDKKHAIKIKSSDEIFAILPRITERFTK